MKRGNLEFMADFRRTQKAKKYMGKSGKSSHFGYSRRQAGSTRLELQGLMATEDENKGCDDDVLVERTQESDPIHSVRDGSKATHTDSECTALTCEEDKEIIATCIARLTGSDMDQDSCANEFTKDSITDGGSFIMNSLQSINESSNLGITFQSEQEYTTPRTKDGLTEDNCYQSEHEVVEFDLADAQVNSDLKQPQSTCFDIRNTSVKSDNSSTDGESKDQSVSIDLSDCVERTQYSNEQDIDLEEDTCRICHCGNENGPLISPCFCTGSVKHIHHSCLMDWLKRCVKTKCELCLQNFSVHRKTKPLKKWRRPDQKPTPIIWLLTFVVALTLNIASITKDGSQKCVSNPCIIFYVVGALGAMLGFAFFYHWLIVSIRYMKQWMALNEEWTLVGSGDTKVLGNENLAASDKSIETKVQRHHVEIV